MRVTERVVAGARLGVESDLATIVRTYEKSLYAFCLAATRNSAEAEDLVQEVFLKVLGGIRGLRKLERFESWLYALARNELSTRVRRTGPAPGSLDPEIFDPPAPSATDSSTLPTEDEAGMLGELFSLLRPEEALVVALRYGGGFSVREIALACALPESTAKSRLDEARRRMRRGARRLDRRVGSRDAPSSLFPRFRIPFGMEERLMDTVETLRLGAFVLERLSQHEQAVLASAARRDERFGEELLAGIGRVEGGAEFLRRVGARLGLKDFTAIVAYADPYTESRLVEALEKREPETAEAYKRLMFVFEDFVLFDEAALDLVIEEAGAERFVLALSACGVPLREEILSRLGEPARRRFGPLLEAARWSPETARAAREEAVSVVRRLEGEGRFRAGPRAEAPRGFLIELAPGVVPNQPS